MESLFNYVIILLTVFVPTKAYIRWGPSNETQPTTPISTATNGTTLSPNPNVVNVANDFGLNQEQFYRAKNRTFHSIRDIINTDDHEEYSDDGIDSGRGVKPKNHVNSNQPTSGHKSTGFKVINAAGKPSRDCNKLPNPTLTPRLPARPRYVKIEWRRTILPAADGITAPKPKLEVYLPPDYSPFYYRKLVDYGSAAAPIIPRPSQPKRLKKSSKNKFPRVISRLIGSKKKRSKVRPSPGYVYVSSLPYASPDNYYYPPTPLSRDTSWTESETLLTPVSNVTKKFGIDSNPGFQGDPRRYSAN